MTLKWTGGSLEDARVLVFDYDRTLTDEERNLAPETVEVISEARLKRGIKVILVLGRGLEFLKKLYNEHLFADALVAENGGSYIYH